MLINEYNYVMNASKNPLRVLPKIVQFQMMIVLSYMWSVVFGLGIGSYLMFGSSAIFHTLFLVGLFFTSCIFDKAKNKELKV